MEERDDELRTVHESSADNGPLDAMAIVRQLQAGAYEDAVKAAAQGERSELMGALAELGATLAREREVREARLSALMEVVVQLATLDFSARAEISDAHDTIDGVAAGLNMLREELQSSTVSRVHLDNVFGSMSDALVVATPDGTIRTVNQAMMNLLGYTRVDLVGRPLRAFFEVDLTESALAELQGKEMSCTTRGGEVVTVAFSTSLLRSGTSTEGFVCVLRDITARKRAEEEQLRLQEALRAQAEVIRRMSTPLIPISNEIVVMPLVGLLDAERAEQVLESLLQGISALRPRVAILDITAIAMIDADVASTIMRAASAARLLGVEVLLTGMRPDVARTLIASGLDLTGVVTCGTLESGIALSMKRGHDQKRR